MKADVMLLNLHAKNTDTQFDLFTTSQGEKQKAKNDKLMQTLDVINQKMDKHTVQLGGVSKQTSWQIKRELLSPHYNTRWDELLQVK